VRNEVVALGLTTLRRRRLGTAIPLPSEFRNGYPAPLRVDATDGNIRQLRRSALAKVADMRRPANNKTEDEVARAMRVAQPGEIHRQRTV